MLLRQSLWSIRGSPLTRFALALTALILSLAHPMARADTVNLSFEDLTDGASVSGQYASLDVAFEHAVALTAGYSLNEMDFPPHSGSVAIGDDLVSALKIDFAGPVSDVSAWFASSAPLHVAVYDTLGVRLGTVDSTGTPQPGSDYLFQIPYTNIGSLMFADSTLGSYVIDDLTYSRAATPTPLPGAMFLFLGGLSVFGIGGARNQRRRREP